MKSKTIVITCGTSLFTNLDDYKYKDFIYKKANFSQSQLAKEDKEQIEIIAQHSLQRLNSIKSDITLLKKSCAELNTIFSYYEDNINEAKRIGDCFYLFTTDTFVGEKGGETLRQYLQETCGLNAYKIKIPNLKADTKVNFEDGVKSLYYSKEINSIFTQGEVVFILSGGFKSWSGYMQALGMFYADKIYYQFEPPGDSLIEIPKIPIELNDEQKQALRLLSVDQKPNDEYLKLLPKTSYTQIGDEYCLDGNGLMLWNDLKKKGFYNKLQASLNENIQYSSNFKKDYEACNDIEKQTLGEKLDKIAIYLKTKNEAYNLKSIRWHEYKNDETYKWEFYPFNGNDSRRAYVKEENGVYIIDKIDSHSK
ncbi:MAG: hypothetical protein LBV16_07440 [Elusimicrobiota bacterium]|jgi:putative CRISPR-associated protein (TIGR02619 family)|nr:hypothetical protein [Elusimicrobiota bacterium]